jgi:hypothetical protein
MPGTGTCSSCGDVVVWAKTERGTTHPPLVPLDLDNVYVITDDVVTEYRSGDIYLRHECDPARVEAHTRYALDRHVVEQAHREEQERLFVMSQARLERAWKRAILFRCPKCGRAPDNRCANLNNVAKNTVWPHAERGNWVVELAHEDALQDD